MNKYKKVLVKLSGSALSGNDKLGFDEVSLNHISNEIGTLVNQGISVCIVVGGGNIFRGNLSDIWNIDRVEADNIGTLGTVINSIMLRGVLKSNLEKEVRVMTSIPITSVAEPYIRLKAIQHLKKGYIVIFAGGNGQPFVTTDYPAVQRAIEMECDALLFAKNGVDGVYDKDPNIYNDAKFLSNLTYDDVIHNNLKVMDQSALILAREHNIPIHVFDFNNKNSMNDICLGKEVGTVIKSH